MTGDAAHSHLDTDITMRTFVRCALAASLVVPSTVAAQATYTSHSAFLAALGGAPQVESFDYLARDTRIAAGTTIGGVTFTSFPVGTSGRVDAKYLHLGTHGLGVHDPYDASFDYFAPDETFSVSFATPVRAVGIFVNALPSPAGSFGIVTPVGTAASAATYSLGGLYFVGLLSTTTFTTATIGGLSGSGASGFTVDQLYYLPFVDPVPVIEPVEPRDIDTPATTTPEPATLALVLLGVGALGMWRRAMQA